MAQHHKGPGQTTNFKASRAERTENPSNSALLISGFDDDTSLLLEEFSRLWEKSGLVAEVIDFYMNNQSRLLTENASRTDSHRHTACHNTGEWQQLVGTVLPYWVFWLTYILTAQAKLVEEDRPMSRAQVAALLNDRLFREIDNHRLFRAHRKRLWTLSR
jgi:hypothetical protein